MKETYMMNAISNIMDNTQKDNPKLDTILMKRIILIIFLSVMVFYVKSQTTTLMDKGKQGFGCKLGIMRGSNYEGAHFGLGFTHKGIVDLNAAYNKRNYDTQDEVLFETGAKSFTKSLSLSYWVLNSEIADNIIIKLGMTGGIEVSTFDNYKYVNWQNTHLVQLENSTIGNIGISTLVNISLEKNWKIQPNLSYTYLLGEKEILELNKSASEPYDSFKTSLGVICGKQFGDTQVFISMNQLVFTNVNENFFQLSAGFAFTLGK